MLPEEWLLFSNFKSWMEQQEEKVLDKDLLHTHNKIYTNCLFSNLGWSNKIGKKVLDKDTTPYPQQNTPYKLLVCCRRNK